MGKAYQAGDLLQVTLDYGAAGKNNGNVAWQSVKIAGVPELRQDYGFETEGRVVGVTGAGTASYLFDGLGRRVKTDVGGVVTTLVYDATGKLAAEYGGPAASEGGVRFATVDALGSTRALTDAAGTVTWRRDYAPYGEELATGNRTGAAYSNGGTRRKFTGKERDAETGLDYFGARYFAPMQGRWTSADAPFADQFVGDPQSWNLYSYTRNNPLRYIDDDGRGIKEVLLGLTNAVSSNAGAVQRIKSSDSDVRLGQKVGDVVTFAGGLLEMAGGGTMAAGGAAACGTGVLCAAGAPAVVGGTAAAAHGALLAGNATASLMESSGDAPGSSGSSETPVGSNPREAKGRINTDLAGGHKAATDKFGNLTKGQKITVDPKSGHQVAADGTRLRLSPDGTARVDIPKSSNRPKHETIHFNDPDKRRRP